VLQRHGGADVAVGLAVDDRSFATAYAGLRGGGRLVLVALPASGMRDALFAQYWRGSGKTTCG